MQFAQNLQKFWKPLLALLGVAATSSAGTVILLMHFNLLNNTEIGSHNPNVTNGQNTSGNPVQGNQNTIGQHNQPDNSINKTENLVLSIGEVGTIKSSVTNIDNSTNNIATSITAVNSSVINIREEIKKLSVEYPNLSSNIAWISTLKEIDSITYRVNDMNQAGIILNNQILNIRQVTDEAMNRSSTSAPSVPPISAPAKESTQSNLSSLETSSLTVGGDNNSAPPGHSEGLTDGENATDLSSVAVPEPSATLGILFVLSGVVALRYWKQTK